MALQEICGIANAPFMQATSFTTRNNDFQYDMCKYSANFEDPICLAAPPFENVRG